MIESTRKRIRRTKQPGGTRRSPITHDEVSASGNKINTDKTGSVNIIATPDFLVGVVPDFTNNQMSEHDKACLASARLLADKNEDKDRGAVVAIIFGEVQIELGQHGVDRVVRLPIAEYAPDKKAIMLCQIMCDQEITYLVFPDSPLGGADLGRRVAAHCGIRAATAVTKFMKNECIRRAFAGTSDIIQPLSKILLVSDEFSETTNGVHEAKEMNVQIDVDIGDISDHGLLPFNADSISLAEAEIVLSAGAGVKDWDSFHKLAKLLNVSIGASRVVVDNGFLDRNNQVGASGNIITARCYLALGISGAPQHLQGIATCESVLSVNIDPNCDMNKRANLAVVGDVQKIMPELISLLESEDNG